MLRRPAHPVRHMHRLARAQDGAAVVEFALVAPAFLLALLGMFDLAYNIYTATLLEGSIQKAARDATIEGASATVDNRVTNAVHEIAPDATVQITRRSYVDYANINQPEDFTDVNRDGRCADGEPFEDANGNGRWDADRASSGQGGARNAVLYEVTVTYDRAFPVDGFVPGVSPTLSTTARTVLRNQPYDLQDDTVEIGSC